MTSNLWGEHADPTALASVLNEVAPDVLVVQELEPEAAGVIAAHFPHHALDPCGETMGSGIATRTDAVFARIPLRYRSGWSAVLDPTPWPDLDTPLEIVGVHMANPAAWPWWRSVGHRRYQLAGLLAHCGTNPMRRVVVGDFNASPAWPLYRRLTSHFTDGALVAGSARRTWRFQGRTPPLLRIDHAFGAGVRFRMVRPVTVPGADHLGLVIDLDL